MSDDHSPGTGASPIRTEADPSDDTPKRMTFGVKS